MIIDSDTHVVEPPDLFTSRMASKHRDLVPQVKFRDDVNEDWWFVGDAPIQKAAGSVVPRRDSGAVRRTEDYSTPARFLDQHPSAWDPIERAKVMDTQGINAAVMYTQLGATGPDIYRKIPVADLAFQLELISAYNDWLLSWPEAAPGRYIPLCVIPYWDLPAAVRELERCAERGMKGVIMTGKPQNHECPILADPHWNDLWAAAEAAKQSISFHVASGGMLETFAHDRVDVMGRGALSCFVVGSEFFQNAITAVEVLTSGILQRHPALNFSIVETGVGWVPFALEALDEHYRRYKPWLYQPEMREDQLPSELFQRQVFVNTWFERARADSKYPYDNVMFETDYPHPTCLMGEEITDAIQNRLAELSPDQLEGVLWRNAMRCFSLEPEDVATDEQLGISRDQSVPAAS